MEGAGRRGRQKKGPQGSWNLYREHPFDGHRPGTCSPLFFCLMHSPFCLRHGHFHRFYQSEELNKDEGKRCVFSTGWIYIPLAYLWTVNSSNSVKREAEGEGGKDHFNQSSACLLSFSLFIVLDMPSSSCLLLSFPEHWILARFANISYHLAYAYSLLLIVVCEWPIFK